MKGWMLTVAFLTMALVGQARAAEAQAASAAAFFDPTRLWTIHLIVQPKEFDAMMPPTASAPAAAQPGAGPKPPLPPLDTEYPYVKAVVELNGQTFKDVGLRYKGNSSFNSSRGMAKRPFKIDFNRHLDDQKFLGMTQLNLNNNAMDASQVRETVAYSLFRDAGVHAPRTTYARVLLTVPGRYDRQLLGLYTVVEEVNKAFLKEHFKSAKGALLKPEKARDLPYLGAEWSAYEKKYDPKDQVTSSQAARIIAFTKLVNDADDATFTREIAQYMDVPGFLRFLAVNTLLANLDSFQGVGHNFYLYLNAQDNKVYWIPWDLNHAFGGFPSAGPPMQQMELSLTHPWMGQNRLIERMLAVDSFKQQYLALVREIAASHFTAPKLHAQIDALSAVIKPVLDEEKKAGIQTPQPPMARQNSAEEPGALKALVARRIESVAAQLAGKSQGQVLSNQRPFMRAEGK